ncbi:hypothetical protein B0H10DRAFT_2063816 [Mycena sp. CBHHK59/15]|nr:hypothetical protein B0H10DRAFT_2063816 [Mycena sp. CBHHK59/15]
MSSTTTRNRRPRRAAKAKSPSSPLPKGNKAPGARAPPKDKRSTGPRRTHAPRRSPIAPLPLPPATVPAAQLLARVMPDANDQARQAFLDDTIRSEGSREAGLALVQRAYDMLNTCPAVGVRYPSASVTARNADRRDSILTDWSQHGIVFRIRSGWGTWEECPTLVILPCTTIRVSYPDGGSGTAEVQLIFPPDPRETPIASHQLA